MPESEDLVPPGASRPAREMITALAGVAVPADALAKAAYFAAKPGHYGAGDRFLGVRVPVVRRIAAAHRGRVSGPDVQWLLDSPWHEVRLLGGITLVEMYRRGDKVLREQVVRQVLANTERLNNWDLVDAVAPYTLGPWLLDHPAERGVLGKLIVSSSLWQRRIALLATFALIRAGESGETLHLAGQVLRDPEDLIHKAAGWMLREVGIRDRARLNTFLDEHAAVMPRVMLRYALEKHPAPERSEYLGRARRMHPS